MDLDLVVEKYPEPSSDVVYTLDHGTANAYAGLDRVGRIIDLIMGDLIDVDAGQFAIRLRPSKQPQVSPR